MVYSEARIKELLHLLVLGHSNVPSEEGELGVVGTREEFNISFLCCRFLQSTCGFNSFLSSMDEHHDLVIFANQLQNTLINHAVEISS